MDFNGFLQGFKKLKPRRGPTPLLPGGYSQDLRQLAGDLLHRDQAQRPSAQDLSPRES